MLASVETMDSFLASKIEGKNGRESNDGIKEEFL